MNTVKEFVAEFTHQVTSDLREDYANQFDSYYPAIPIALHDGGMPDCV
jgi:hypothetical protein